jgi:hypothetical protein
MGEPMLSILSLAFLLGGSAPAADPAIETRLAATRAFAAAEGERLWPGYGAAPFGFLLLEPDKETLLCHASVPPGFTAAGRDAATGCDRYTRARGTLPAQLLAAMPMFGPPSVIVMGTPEATGFTPAAWTRFILHEHFHQYQAALPRYYARVDALDLSGGDRTGMWMLNYSFPYGRTEVQAAFAGASRALGAAVAARRGRGFAAAFDRYLATRAAFEKAVSPADWRYFEFQLWQEGVARWTELALGAAYPDPEVRAASAAAEDEMLAELARPDLGTHKRIVAYAYGAGEAMLMERCGPGWRARYPDTMATGPLLRAARAECS